MCEVIVNCRDSRRHMDEVEQAIREFKRAVKKAGILSDLRKHEYYVAPAKKRRLKAEESLKQRRRDERKTKWQQTKNDF